MDRYRSFLLPGVAALVVLAYYAWRWSSGVAPVEPAPAPAPATSPKTPAPAEAPVEPIPAKKE